MEWIGPRLFLWVGSSVESSLHLFLSLSVSAPRWCYSYMLSIDPSEMSCCWPFSVCGYKFRKEDVTTYYTPERLPRCFRDFLPNLSAYLSLLPGSPGAESSLSSIVYLVSIMEKKVPLSLKLGKIF